MLFDKALALETARLEGKVVLCPDLPSRRDQVPPQCEPGPHFRPRHARDLSGQRQPVHWLSVTKVITARGAR